MHNSSSQQLLIYHEKPYFGDPECHVGAWKHRIHARQIVTEVQTETLLPISDIVFTISFSVLENKMLDTVSTLVVVPLCSRYPAHLASSMVLLIHLHRAPVHSNPLLEI